MLCILQVSEKDGNLVFIVNEQDLDSATMEMISQRFDIVSPNGFVV